MSVPHIHKQADCLGCSLANGELPVHMVYENESVACLLDHDPFHEGHVLILPKPHYRYIDEFDEETALALLHASQLMSAAIKKRYAPFGITLAQNGGGVDDLTHFHLHLVPRAEHQSFESFYNEDPWDNKDLKQKLSETCQELAAAVEEQLALLPGK